MSDLDKKARVCILDNVNIELTIAGTGDPTHDQPYDQKVVLSVDEARQLADQLLSLCEYVVVHRVLREP
jgi:hypothetical protein